MNTLIIIGAVLMVLGIVGSIIPALPGPVFGYIGLILLYFAEPNSVSILSLVIFGIAMVIIMLANYIAPILGAKFLGASKKGLTGAIAGSIMGVIFFPPFGIFIGALAGAFLGEIIDGKEWRKAFRAGIGTIFGSILIIILQTIFSLTMAVYFFLKLFS